MALTITGFANSGSCSFFGEEGGFGMPSEIATITSDKKKIPNNPAT